MNGETMHVNGSNGTAPETPSHEPADQAAAPSIETTLFKAGLITADQLGEVVLERVQSGRPAGEIVLERGLVAPEILAGMLAAAQPPAAEAAPAAAVEQPAPAFVPAPAPVAELVAPAAPAPQSLVDAPAALPAEPVAAAPATPVAPSPAEPAAVPAPAPIVDPVPVQPVVEAPPAVPAAEVAHEAPAAVAAEPQQQTEPAPAAAGEDERGFSMGEVHYGIRIRLSEGVTLDAGSYPSRERAIEVARGIAGQLATEGGEWPLVGDTLVRPDAVLAIEIESAVSWFASRNA